MDMEEEDCKDIYAQVGLAVYWVQCLETTLTNILLFNGRIRGTAPTEQDLDDLEASLQKQKTLGGLIKQVQTEAKLPETAEALINEALRKRNFLIHHFFRERAYEWVTAAGRARMRAELQETQAILRTADQTATLLCMALAKLLGITPEWINAEAERMKQEALKADERPNVDSDNETSLGAL
jgi:hypothetical protein